MKIKIKKLHRQNSSKI